MKTISLNGKWSVKNAETGAVYLATVPGDIHNDLMKADLIPNPFYSDNANCCGWVTQQDWVYEKSFVVTEEMLEKDLKLVFDGIDTYSEIAVNGAVIGTTDNMFLRYVFAVNNFVKVGENTLSVRLFSVKKKGEEFPKEDYFACFNLERIFMRKAQCHFSWDWAPNFPATGIWQGVSLEVTDGAVIDCVTIHPHLDGRATFFVHMLKGKGKYDPTERFLRVKVWDDEQCVEKVLAMTGAKNVINIEVNDVKLWWPREMGEPHLYQYEVTAIDHGAETYVKRGRFGFRTVELDQSPIGDDRLSCRFKINGKEVFLKGANWVPLDIMTGCIDDEKYRRAIQLAQDANYNCLRVWGGGIYEKDIFFDICDEIGMLAWQDVQLACSDIPDDYPGFADRVIEEVEQQIIRLQCHPSFFVTTGGNEKTGSYGEAKTRGDRLVYHTLRGLLGHIDGTRPYLPSSPYSFVDVGNNLYSGDTHTNSFQLAMGSNRLHEFREVLKGLEVSLASEVAVQGSCRVEALKKFIPEDMLWPLNDIYHLHFTRNPYDGQGGVPFAEIQLKMVNILFGNVDGVNDFVKKSMMAHCELVRADAEFHRARRGNCGGAMFWMFSDIWPSGTWALVDYYLIPKASYYTSKLAFRPISPIITKTQDGTTLFIVNDTLEDTYGTVTWRYVDIYGNVYAQGRQAVTAVATASTMVVSLEEMIEKGSQKILIAEFEQNGKIEKTFYYPDLWKEAVFEDPKLHIDITRKCENCATVSITATESFARAVNILVPDFATTDISDNFFDMEKGETRVIEIKAKQAFSTEEISVKTWLNEWDR